MILALYFIIGAVISFYFTKYVAKPDLERVEDDFMIGLVFIVIMIVWPAIFIVSLLLFTCNFIGKLF